MKKTSIIAEAGVNHNGSTELAKKLIDIAVEAKCDYVKFQTYKTENLIIETAPKAEYQNLNDNSKTAFEMLKKLELSQEDTKILKEYAQSKNIKFISTPFDIESAEFLNNIGQEIFKISSGDITNLPLLEKINSFKKEVILSTGMATIDEIKGALGILKDCKISLMHCTTEYPCPYNEVNLNAIETLKKEFNLPIGYSDHTQGIEIAIGAVAKGAEIIEKHFTSDKNLNGPDHKASLNPQELKEMVNSIRNLEKAFGSAEKTPQKNEIKNKEIVRKSIVAKKNIKKGELFTKENLTTKRPATGISPMKWYDIISKKASKDYKKDEIIDKENI